MKKSAIQFLVLLSMLSGSLQQLRAQCSFTGLGPAYCRNAAAVTLTPGTPGGYFWGSGIIGSVFNPTIAGAGTHTISYGICTNSYNISTGTFSLLPAAGNSVSLPDDGISGPLPMGFDFKFFCNNTYSAFVISSNGFISFDPNAANGCCTGQFLPNAGSPNNLIAFAWQDLDPDNGNAGMITYTTLGTQPNRVMVMTFSNVPHYSGGNNVTAQLQLYEGTNEIQIHTASMPTNGGGHTMGIEDAGGSVAYVVAGRNSSGSWSATNEMYRFTPIFSCVSSQTTLVDGTNLAVAGPDTLCLHSTTTFTASGTTTYTWNPPGSGNMLTVTPPAGINVYTVSGMAPGSLNCLYSTSFTLNVLQTPVNATSSTTLLCVGSSATLTAGGASTYTWSNGPNTTTTTVSPVANETYTVWGTSIYGCVEQFTVEQAVNTNTVTISTNTEVCLGSAVTLTAGSVTSFSWNTGSPFASITVTPVTLTTYSLAATDQFNCYHEGFVTVTVNPIPNVTITTPKTKVCKGDLVIFTAAGASTYSWSSPPGGTGQTMTVIPQVDVPYTFTVQGVDSKGCRDDFAITIIVDRCNGVSESAGAAPIDIFPNPATSSFFIRVGDKAGSYRAEVYNSVGALVQAQDLQHSLSEIDLSAAAKGMYLIRISEGNRVVQVSRLIKQ
jgi:hypothetical protein